MNIISALQQNLEHVYMYAKNALLSVFRKNIHLHNHRTVLYSQLRIGNEIGCSVSQFRCTALVQIFNVPVKQNTYLATYIVYI